MESWLSILVYIVGAIVLAFGAVIVFTMVRLLAERRDKQQA
jgi:hypothetical protein